MTEPSDAAHPAEAERTGSQLDPAESSFDVFISYSRADDVFAELLHRALGRYRPPAGLGLDRRPLRVFRDVSDIDAGGGYTPAIENALRSSRKLLVLCTPSARASPWVDDEIRRFAKLVGPEHIIPVLVQGEPSNAVTESEQAAAFPDALVAALDIPLAIDYRGFDVDGQRIDRGDHYSSWYALLARIYDVGRAQIEQRDRRRRRRRRLVGAATVSGVMLALAALSAWALVERAEAERQTDVAVARLLANEASAIDAVDVASRERKALLAIASLRRLDRRGETSEEADRALRTALALFARPLMIEVDGQTRAQVLAFERWEPLELAFSADGSTLTIRDAFAQIHRWRYPESVGAATSRIESVPGKPAVAKLSPDGSHVAVADGYNWEHRPVRVLRVTDIDGPPVALLDTREFFELAAGGRRIMVEGPDAKRLVDVASGKEIVRFDDAFHAAFSPDGEFLATSHGLRQGTKIWRIRGEGPDASVEALWSLQRGRVTFGTDSRFVAASSSGAVWIHDVVDGKVLRNGIRAPDSGTPNEIWVLGPEARLLVVGIPGNGSRIEILDTETGAALTLPGSPNDIAIGPDGRLLAVATARTYVAESKVAVWELLRFSEIFAARHTRSVHELRVVSDPPSLITFTRDADGWWTEVRALGEDFPRRRSDVHHGDGRGWISATGHTLAFHADTTVRFWNVPAGEEVSDVHVGMDLASIWLDEDGPYAVLDHGDRVRVIDVRTGSVAAEVDYAGEIEDVRFDEHWQLCVRREAIVGAGTRGERRQTEHLSVDLQTGAATGPFFDSFCPPRETAYAANRTADGEIDVVRRADARVVARIDPGAATQLTTLSDDGRYLAALSGSHVVRVWFLAAGDLIERACAFVSELGIGEEEWRRLAGDVPYEPACVR